MGGQGQFICTLHRLWIYFTALRHDDSAFGVMYRDSMSVNSELGQSPEQPQYV